MKAKEESANLVTEETVALGEVNQWQELLHLLVALMSWLLFVYFWYITLAYKFSGRRQFLELLGLFLFTVAIFSVAVTWVRHNIKIWLRKGPRKQVPVVNKTVVSDRFGRQLELSEEALNSNYIKIIVNKKTKKYVIYKSARSLMDD